MSNIAEIGGANVERKIGKASVRDAIIGTGVAIDKMLALTGQSPVGIQIANIRMPSPEEREETNRRHRALDEITRLLHKQGATEREGRTHGESADSQHGQATEPG